MEYLRGQGGLLGKSMSRGNPHVDPIVVPPISPQEDLGPGAFRPIPKTPAHHPSDIDPWAGRENPGNGYWPGYDSNLTPAPPQIDITNLGGWMSDQEMEGTGYGVPDETDQPMGFPMDEGTMGIGEPTMVPVTRVEQAIEKFGM